MEVFGAASGSDVMIAAIAAVPATIGAWAALRASRRSGRAESKAAVAAEQAAVAVEQTKSPNGASGPEIAYEALKRAIAIEDRQAQFMASMRRSDERHERIEGKVDALAGEAVMARAAQHDAASAIARHEENDALRFRALFAERGITDPVSDA